MKEAEPVQIITIYRFRVVVLCVVYDYVVRLLYRREYVQYSSLKLNGHDSDSFSRLKKSSNFAPPRAARKRAKRAEGPSTANFVCSCRWLPHLEIQVHSSRLHQLQANTGFCPSFPALNQYAYEDGNY
jgi:hypothetical protein